MKKHLGFAALAVVQRQAVSIVALVGGLAHINHSAAVGVGLA